MFDPILSDYLDEAGAATELGVCPRTLRRWRDRSEGPAFTIIGRRVRYRRGAIVEWLASQERQP